MTFISVLFLVIELLIIGLGAFIGYKRGIGKSAVRVVYLAIIAVATFFIAKTISTNLSTSIFNLVYDFIPLEDVKHLLDKSPELDALIANLIGALATPVIFAFLFLVLQLLSLIFFKTISGKIVSAITSKSEAPNTASKWIGTGVGLVSAMAVAAILLSPVYTAIHVIDNTPDETVQIFVDAIGGKSQAVRSDTRALKAQPLAGGFDYKPSFAVTKLHPLSDLISEAATSYEVPDAHEKESAAHSLPILVDVLGDVLYVHKSTISHGGSAMDALSNSVAAVTPHLGESITVKDAATCALSALGQILIEDGQFMGFTLPQSENALVDGITHNILDTMSHTTLDSVNENMTMLFGTVGDELMPEHKRHSELDPLYDTGTYDGKDGLLKTVDHMKNNNLSQEEMLKQALNIFEGNAEITEMINTMLADYIADQIPEHIGIDKDIIKDILDNSDIDITEIDINNLTQEDILGMIKDNDIVIDDSTLEEIKDALGNDNITEDDINDFLENGNLGDIDLGDIDLGDLGKTDDTTEIDLGDIDLGDVDLGDVDLGDIDLGDIDLDDLDSLKDKYGDLFNSYLN